MMVFTKRHWKEGIIPFFKYGDEVQVIPSQANPKDGEVYVYRHGKLSHFELKRNLMEELK